MTNWPEKLANDLSDVISDVPIYSNVDPNRAYVGGETVEFNVQKLENIPLLSGGVFKIYSIVAACRALTFGKADELLNRIRDTIVPILQGYTQNELATNAFASTSEITPDVRGIIEGESFYGLLNIVITETIKG